MRVLTAYGTTGFFGSALNKDKTLQEPMMHAHMAAALAEGEVHIAELPSAGVVGVAVWYAHHHTWDCATLLKSSLSGLGLDMCTWIRALLNCWYAAIWILKF